MTSKHLFERAQIYIPGGVNSPVRAFNSVGGTPVFLGGKGSILIDVGARNTLIILGLGDQ